MSSKKRNQYRRGDRVECTRHKEHFLVSSVRFCCFAELVGIWGARKVFVSSETGHWITSECEKEIGFVQSYRKKCKVYSNSEIIYFPPCDLIRKETKCIKIDKTKQ